jgi:hypothetical protein
MSVVRLVAAREVEDVVGRGAAISDCADKISTARGARRRNT